MFAGSQAKNGKIVKVYSRNCGRIMGFYIDARKIGFGIFEKKFNY